MALLGVAAVAGGGPARATDLAVITGTVFNEESRPLPGVRLTLVGEGFGTQVTVTDAGGVYRFPGLRPLLTYRISATCPGYRRLEYAGLQPGVGRIRALDFHLKQPGVRDIVVLTGRDPFPREEMVSRFTALAGAPVRVIDLDREPDAAERVRRVGAERPNLILAAGLRPARLVRSEIRDIPAILTLIDDPRRYDLRADNLCFITNNPPADEVMRRFALILPRARRIGLVYDADGAALLARDLRRAAENLGMSVELRPAYGPRTVAGQLLSQAWQPSDIDVRALTRHVMAINKTTALALGISVPSDLRVDVAFGAGPLALP